MSVGLLPRKMNNLFDVNPVHSSRCPAAQYLN